MVINFLTNRQDHDPLLYKSIKFKVGSNLDTLRNYVENTPYCGIDSEFNSKRYHQNDCLLISLGDRDNQFVIDWTDPEMREKCPAIINRIKLFIGQNLQAEYFVLRKYGIKMPVIYDTFVAQQRLDLGIPHLLYNLTDIRLRMLHKQPNSMDRGASFMNMTWSSKFDIGQIMYSADDIEDLVPLAIMQRDIFKARKQYDFMKNVEFNLVQCLADMELEGIYCYPDKWTKIIDERKKEKLLCEQKLDKLVDQLLGTKTRERRKVDVVALNLFGDSVVTENRNVAHLNYGSPNQVLKIWEKLKLPPPMLKEKGKDPRPSTKEEALQQYVINNPGTKMEPFINELLKQKEHTKFISGYGLKFLQTDIKKKGKKPERGYLNPFTGKVHTTYKQCETDTGRLASGRAKEGYFNSQNLPAKKAVRECFGLTPQEIKDGWWITTCDLSGAELIIMAALANDQHLYELGADKIINGVKVEGDLHSPFATNSWRAVYKYRLKKKRKMTIWDTEKKAYELTPDFEVSKKVNKQLRTDFKRMGFGTVYGLKPNKGAQTLNIPIDEAAVVIDVICKEIPLTINMVEEAAACALTDGYVVFNHRSYNRRWFKPVLDILEELPKDMDRSERYEIVKSKLSFKDLSEIEGAARNCRIQGTQADMIKEAKVVLYQHFNKYNLDAKLLLTIHDELVVKHKDPALSEFIATTMTDVANSYLSIYSNNIKMRCEYHRSHTWTK